MYRVYIRKNDMDEFFLLEDGSSYGGKDYKKQRKKNRRRKDEEEEKEEEDDDSNLEEKFYKYGVRSEWFQINRIINYRQIVVYNVILYVYKQCLFARVIVEIDI